VLLEAGKPHLLQRRAHPLAQIGIGHSQILGAEGHVVFDEGGHQLVVGVLEHQPRVGADEVGELGVAGVFAEHFHLPLVGGQKRVDVLGDGALTRAVAPQQAQELALRHFEPQVLEHEGLAVVGEAGVLEADERRIWRIVHGGPFRGGAGAR